MEQTHCVDSARQYKTMKEDLGKNKSLAPCISCFRITTTTTGTRCCLQICSVVAISTGVVIHVAA